MDKSASPVGTKAPEAAAIPAGVSFTGNLVCDSPECPVVIGGKLRGTIRSAGPVFVSETGVVEGSIRAPRITIGGRVLRASQTDGVVADGQLSLSATARLECNAVYEEIAAERGATLAGTMVPFNSEFFHELSVGGTLPFVDALERVLPGSLTAAAVPAEPAAVAAPAASLAPAPPAAEAEPLRDSEDPSGSARAHLRPVAAWDAGSLRSLEVTGGAGPEHPYLHSQPGQVAHLATGTHGPN